MAAVLSLGQGCHHTNPVPSWDLNPGNASTVPSQCAEHISPGWLVMALSSGPGILKSLPAGLPHFIWPYLVLLLPALLPE